MPGTNLTRDEAATRAALMDVTSYAVELDLTKGDKIFGSTTTIRFTSRETGAEILHAYLKNETLTEVVNVPNVGQIPELPMGACVETFGMIDGLGVRPVVVDGVPAHLLEVMRPQAVNQKWVTEGAMKRDKEMLLQALYNDPQCAPLHPGQIRAMADELLGANRSYITL